MPNSDCAGRNTLAATFLGDLELSPDLVLSGQHEWCAASIAQKRTIDGRHLWFADTAQGGRVLRLEGQPAYFTVGELARIRTLQAQARPVLLRHHSGVYRVLIQSIESPDLLDEYNADYSDDDRIGATINLIEVLP